MKQNVHMPTDYRVAGNDRVRSHEEALTEHCSSVSDCRSKVDRCRLEGMLSLSVCGDALEDADGLRKVRSFADSCQAVNDDAVK